MNLKNYKVLTFDVVGTLIDFERGMLNYVRKVAPDSKVSDEAFFAAYREARKRPDVQWFPDDLVMCWHLIAPGLGLPDSDEIAQGFRESAAGFPAFEDSAEALKRLRKHYKLVAMTNAQAWAMSHFAATLGNPFDMSITCDVALSEKPDLQFFAYARGRIEGAWGFKKADNLHVAQSQYHDIAATRKLGIDSCWIQRRHDQVGSGGTIDSVHTEPDIHYLSLAQLADAVEASE
jgi:putative hydrolase of the HAD superfamily